MSRLGGLLAIALACLGSCQTALPPQEPGDPNGLTVGTPADTTGVRAFAAWIPGLVLTREDDPDPLAVIDPGDYIDNGQGVAFGADIGGPGKGIRAMFVMASDRDDADAANEFYWLTPEVYVGARIGEGDFAFTPRIGAGAGVGVLSRDSTLVRGTASIGGSLTVELFERYSIEVMAGGFVWGYPGETDGLGGYVGIGGGISF